MENLQVEYGKSRRTSGLRHSSSRPQRCGLYFRRKHFHPREPITPSRPPPPLPPSPRGKLSSAQVASSPQLSAITTLSTPPSFPQPRMAYPHQAVEFLCWRVRPPLETIAAGRGSGLINAGSGGGGNHFRPYQSWVVAVGGGEVVSISCPSKFVQKRVNSELLRSTEIKVRVYVPFWILQISTKRDRTLTWGKRIFFPLLF